MERLQGLRGRPSHSVGQESRRSARPTCSAGLRWSRCSWHWSCIQTERPIRRRLVWRAASSAPPGHVRSVSRLVEGRAHGRRSRLTASFRRWPAGCTDLRQWRCTIGDPGCRSSSMTTSSPGQLSVRLQAIDGTAEAALARPLPATTAGATPWFRLRRWLGRRSDSTSEPRVACRMPGAAACATNRPVLPNRRAVAAHRRARGLRR